MRGLNFPLNAWIITVLKSFCFFNRNYLVTLPAQLHFPSTQKVCLDLSPGYYDVKFTITLETKGKTQKLLEHHGMQKRHLHCVSFLVSTDLAPTLIPCFPTLLLRRSLWSNFKCDLCYLTFARALKPISPKLDFSSWPSLIHNFPDLGFPLLVPDLNFWWFFPFFLAMCFMALPWLLPSNAVLSFHPPSLGLRPVNSVPPSLLSWPGTTSCGRYRRSGYYPGVRNRK